MAIDYSNLSWSQRVTQGKLRVTRRSQRVTRKFLEVSRCLPPKQWQGNVPKKCTARAKLLVLFLLIRPTKFFWTFSLPSPLGITRF